MTRRDDPAGWPWSARATAATDQPISYLMAEALKRPGLISLAAGFVDNATLPHEHVHALADDLLTDPDAARGALQYGTTLGLPALRQGIVDHLASLDPDTPEPPLPDAAAERTVVTTGSQQALHLITDLLVDPGDTVLCAWPSYFVYTGALSSFAARVQAIDTDDRGIVPAAVERALHAHRDAGTLHRVKLLYVQSAHQNPTGLTLAHDRRHELVQLLRQLHADTGHRVLLIEDAAYRELTYDGPPPPAMLAHDPDHQHVAYLGTFSKPFAPGLKTGYALLPHGLHDAALLNKGGRDFGSPNLNQHLLARALATGRYAAHVQTLRDAYRPKRDAMLAALDDHLADTPGITWTRPTGGLYVWVTLPKGCDARREGPLFQSCLESGVMYVPGDYCYTTDAPPINEFRLSFGHVLPNQINEGINRLATAIGAHVGG